MADVIDRQELRKILLDRVVKLDHERGLPFSSGYEYTQGRMDECDFIEDCILSEMPTVEPRRGEWEAEREVERGITTFTLVKCSVCGQWALKKIHNAIQNLGEAQLRYCPNCGASMRGEEDD